MNPDNQNDKQDPFAEIYGRLKEKYDNRSKHE